MKKYLHLLQQDFPAMQESDLFLPIKEANIDSLDIVFIRVTLEKYFGLEVSDATWYKHQTLSEALQYFDENKRENILSEPVNTKPVTHSDSIEIRMPQMANNSLSESWLLKFLGDTHWTLLSKGFNKISSDFRDDYGNRIYATFIRIKYSTSPLHYFNENNRIDFNSKVEGFGNNSFMSQIEGRSGDNEVNAQLLTTFSIRVNSNNNEITKGNIEIIPNTINQVVTAPALLNNYRLLKKGLLEEFYTDFGSFPNCPDVVFSCEYEVNPYYEINGVGLLYFAAYPIISDSCLLKYFSNSESLSFSTIYRDIFYFANCNPKDTIDFQLNFIEREERILKTLTSLYRKSDNKLLAKILTVKEKISQENCAV